jgi:hypothetical protein
MNLGNFLEAIESYKQFISLAPTEHYKDQIERARSILALLEKANRQSP